MDHFLSMALNFVVIALITGMAAGALVCGHAGMLRMLSGAPVSGGALLATAAALGIAAHLLIRHRDDLADR